MKLAFWDGNMLTRPAGNIFIWMAVDLFSVDAWPEWFKLRNKLTRQAGNIRWKEKLSTSRSSEGRSMFHVQPSSPCVIHYNIPKYYGTLNPLYRTERWRILLSTIGRRKRTHHALTAQGAHTSAETCERNNEKVNHPDSRLQLGSVSVRLLRPSWDTC
jgi:hypothetical protein